MWVYEFYTIMKIVFSYLPAWCYWHMNYLKIKLYSHLNFLTKAWILNLKKSKARKFHHHNFKLFKRIIKNPYATDLMTEMTHVAENFHKYIGMVKKCFNYSKWRGGRVKLLKHEMEIQMK